MSHRPYVLPTPDGYRAACACTFLTAETQEILIPHLWGVQHRRWEEQVEKIIREMDRKGFMIALEDLDL